MIPKLTPGTFPIPEILPKPSKEEIAIVKFPKIGEPMVLQAPKPRASKKGPASARANSFNPSAEDEAKNARKEELGVPELPRDERRASESRAADITRQHVRPAITRTDSEMALGDSTSPRSSTSPRYDINPKVRTTPTPPVKPGGITRMNSSPNFNFQVRIGIDYALYIAFFSC